MTETPKHARHVIRDQMVERLKDQTPVGPKIYANRLKPLFEKHLPCLLVYTLGEDVDASSYDGDGHLPLLRSLKLAVEALVVGADGHDDRLDEIALIVEQRLDDWWVTGFEPCQFRLTETDFTAIEEGAVPFLACRLTYEFTYHSPRHQRDAYGYEN